MSQAAASIAGLLLAWGVLPAGADETVGTAVIRNPYFETTAWRVWRDDPTPLEGVETLTGSEGAEQRETVTLAPPEERWYPVDPEDREDGRFLQLAPRAVPSERYAGIWDDVYASWSGLHGDVRPTWKDAAGNEAQVKDRILRFVDTGQDDVLRAGVNFLHQSTTGMGHTITNWYDEAYSRRFERLYFSDCLVTAPAHASFTDGADDRSSDLYLALVPTLLNSVGSSNSETMAITKLILVGGHLRPELKRTLKRHGLYPSALLYLWKAALPYDVPYDHELRHRVAYKAVGDRARYPGGYGAAGIERGDKSLEFHQYDDSRHMRNMVALAEGLEAPPPEACFGDVRVTGGTLRYAMRKSALVLQEPGQDVTIEVDTSACYDLEDRPLTRHWTLLHGTRGARLAQDPDGSTAVITVPWDESLSEGRTVFGLFAHNGISDGNPALLTVYRVRGDLPPNGGGGGGYQYPGTHTNRRPLLLNAQDLAVRPGRTVEREILAVDPEGFPVRLYRRAGQPGDFDGSAWTWKCPSRQEDGVLPVTVIASDGTSGNSYAGATLNVHVGRPDLLAQVEVSPWVGAAPLTVTCSAADSLSKSRAEHGWVIRRQGDETAAPAFEDQEHGRSIERTLSEPGLYQVTLTLRSKEGEDTQAVWVLVKEPDWQPRPAALSMSGNGVRIEPDALETSPFDGTDFGTTVARDPVVRTFLLHNEGDLPVQLPAKAVTLGGEHARDFRVERQPRRTLGPRGTATFDLRFAPREAGRHSATVEVETSAGSFLFEVAGQGR